MYQTIPAVHYLAVTSVISDKLYKVLFFRELIMNVEHSESTKSYINKISNYAVIIYWQNNDPVHSMPHF